jgi:DNA polymerase (family 10)
MPDRRTGGNPRKAKRAPGKPRAKTRTAVKSAQAVSTTEVPERGRPGKRTGAAREPVAPKRRTASAGAKKPRRQPEEIDRSQPANKMTAAEIARVLQEIASLLELTGENVFKVRAYDNAARILPGVGDALQALIEEHELPDVPGIGTGIADRIEVLARTGRLPYHDELKSRVPPGLLDMLHVPGLGPKKIKLLHESLDIGGIDELERACKEGRLLELRGFGEKSQQNILTGIEQYRRIHTRFLWRDAAAYAAPVFAALRSHPDVQRAEIAGSLRRKRETVKDVDLLVSTTNGAAVSQFFAAGAWAARVLGSGTTKTSIVHTSGLQMDMRVVTDREFPHALHHFTGSKAHNVAMRGRAQRMGLKINEYGLFRGDELITCGDEAHLFNALGLEFIPPELREDMGEIAAAETLALPKQLLEVGDLRGAFHVHTADGSGSAPLRDMLAACGSLGWEWVGISNSTRGAHSERGLPLDRVADHLADLRRAADQARGGPQLLCGIVAAILPDGTLDVPDALLQRFDFVIAAVRSTLDLDRDTQTRRIVRGLENPCVTILAHPMGRALPEDRAPELDLPAVIDAAVAHDVVLEINGDPRRMDLDGAMTKLARDKGARFCVDPDARTPDELRQVEYGVAMARRGWLEAHHVVNTGSAAEVEAQLGKRRGGMRKATL